MTALPSPPSLEDIRSAVWAMAPKALEILSEHEPYRSRIAFCREHGIDPLSAEGLGIVRPTPRSDRWRCPPSVRTAVYTRDGYACLKCGATENLSIDHVTPRSWGGHDGEDNLQTLCLPCNIEKCNYSDADYRIENCPCPPTTSPSGWTTSSWNSATASPSSGSTS